MPGHGTLEPLTPWAQKDLVHVPCPDRAGNMHLESRALDQCTRT